MWNDRGHEFYALIPDPGIGFRKLREARDAALEAIYSAIQQGADPGEIKP